MRRYLATSRLLWLSAAIALGIGLLVAKQLSESRATVWQRAQAANTNLLFTVSHVLERALRSADLSVQYTVQELETAGGNLSALSLPDNVLFGAIDHDGDDTALVVDHQGAVVRASSPLLREPGVLANRDYFVAHLHNPGLGLYVSRAYRSPSDGQPSVALSRAWRHPDGSFGGVVVQSIKLNRLQKLFSSIELGSDSGINLFLSDGTIIMRFPYTGDTTGKSLSGTPNFDRFIREKEGSFTGVAAIDDMERLYTFRALSGYPLLVNIAQTTDSILGAWRRDAFWLGATTLVLMLACFMLAGLAERELRAHQRTARRLHRAESDIRTILDSLPAIVAYWDKNRINRFSNRAHQQWFGLTPDQIHGMHIRDMLGEDRYAEVEPYIDRALAGQTQVFENAYSDVAGVKRHSISTYIPDMENDQIQGLFVLVHDITDRKAAEDSLSEEKERFRVTLAAIRDGVITTDAEGRITYQNPAAVLMTGWTPEQALGQAVSDVIIIQNLQDKMPVETCAINTALSERSIVKSGADHVLIGRSGVRTHIEATAAPIIDENDLLLGAVMVFHDVSQARAKASEMMYLAQHDALTGLPNRRFLHQLVNQAIARGARSGRYAALLYVDLDKFKNVNDTLGHAAGDELLVTMANRLSETLRQGDIVSRKGGDEFIVLMDSLNDPLEAGQLAQRLLEHCRKPVQIAGRSITVTLSIGISLFPDDGTDFDQLMCQADKAMYRAKQAGRNQFVYSQDKHVANIA